MFKLRHSRGRGSNELLASNLYDQGTFYPAFICDLKRAKRQVVIESPYITGNRIASLLLILLKMRSRNIRITINTRHPDEHEAPYNLQAQAAVEKLQDIGIEVLFTGRLHRKLAIFDNQVLWEGSLNILSQNDSCEIMRRIDSEYLANQMLHYTSLDKFI